MFKTERSNNLDSRYNQYNEPVKSRFMMLSKKKYYLASADHNLDQLKEEQIQSLTELLIELKGEYDELIRETNIKKKETEKIGKQIYMLEKMDKKTEMKQNTNEENLSNMETLVELKKKKKEEELYSKTTLENRTAKMREEIQFARKEITEIELTMKNRKKKLEQERITENGIKEKVNQVYSKIHSQRMKNMHDRDENNLILQYYNNIIEQKWAFIYATDERKAKQIKIAKDAKNDSQDKEEVEKRKILFLYFLYDKYLRKKMEKELKENEVLEEIFHTIRDITGNSNLKIMVDKILNKDKNYNLCVSKVAEKQNRIDILKSDILKLEVDFQQLRNNINEQLESNSEDQNNTTDTNSKSGDVNLSTKEEEDLKMMKEEEQLIEELKLLQEKHTNVKLVYEKVVDNIKTLCKMEKKDETLNITHNLNESKIVDSSNLNVYNQSSFNLGGNHVNDDELLKNYSEFLENTKKTIDELILIHPRESFLKIMKEKGIEPASSRSNKGATVKLEKKITLGSLVSHRKLSGKEGMVKPKIKTANEEYGYSDDDLKKEDDEIREEKEQIMKSFKTAEKNRLIEALKSEKTEKEKK